MDNLLRALRSTARASGEPSYFFSGKVSADKCRLKDESFDLDLTYITDRIIAMSFPADGYEKAFRNDVDEVAAFLQVRSFRACSWLWPHKRSRSITIDSSSSI
jgi:hypothetical protein